MTSYEVVRSTTVAAEPATLHALIDDLHAWQQWSPWEDLDPDLQRTYSGPDRGVGAHYAWSGNRRAGRGSMEIVRSEPEQVDVTLVFLKPFSSTSEVAFLLTPATGGGTTVHWRMRGEQSGIWGLLGRFVSMNRLIGKDFEKGLARLKAAAEA